jgi:hypothetical protein
MVRRLGPRRGTIGGDKGFDRRPFVDGVRAAGKTPHVEARVRGSAIDGRTTRHPGYDVSQRLRKRFEDLRVDEDRGLAPEAPASRSVARRVDVHLHGRGVQPRSLLKNR